MAPRSRQLDLLEDWTPPAPTERFEEHKVRAGSPAGRISRAVAAALNESRLKRSDIAKAMSEFLGETVTINMLNAYASQEREQHKITLLRFLALVHATRDRRLLQLFAEPMGWAVIDSKHLPLIELAMVQDKQEELRQQAAALRQKARIRGAL
jgi:hypothetical protein